MVQELARIAFKSGGGAEGSGGGGRGGEGKARIFMIVFIKVNKTFFSRIRKKEN